MDKGQLGLDMILVNYKIMVQLSIKELQFNSDATEDMAFLNNLVGLHITKVGDNNQATKIWKWQ
jgi:hypothetical protein